MSNLPLKLRAKLVLVLYIQCGELWLVNRWLKWKCFKNDASLLALRDELHADIAEIHVLWMKGELLYAEVNRRQMRI